MLADKVYLKFLKEGKCQEAHDALEKACDEKDAYALFLKAQFVDWECLTYRRDSGYRDELEQLSALLGCPWFYIICGNDSNELLVTIDKDNDPFWWYYKYLHAASREELITYLRQSANLGYPISQFLLIARTGYAESEYWLNKAMELHSLDAFAVAADNCFMRCERSKGAKLLIQGNNFGRITNCIEPFRVEVQEEDRLRELCMYGEFACTTKTSQYSWFNKDHITIVYNLYKGCQRILEQSLVAWFIICKRFCFTKDIRILVAKLIIESKYDAYLYGYRLNHNGEVCLKTAELNKKI